MAYHEIFADQQEKDDTLEAWDELIIAVAEPLLAAQASFREAAKQIALAQGELGKKFPQWSIHRVLGNRVKIAMDKALTEWQGDQKEMLEYLDAATTNPEMYMQVLVAERARLAELPVA